MTPGPRVLFSCAEESFIWASTELRALLGARCRLQRLAPDLGGVSGAGVEQLAEACEHGRVVFVRHLTHELEGGLASAADTQGVARRLLQALERAACPKLSLQTWSSGPVRHDLGAAQLYALLRDALQAGGHEIARGGENSVASCCLFGDSIAVGLNQLRFSLCDWPGGRVRLARHPERISRAEFKLEELFKLRPPPQGSVALDLGASPGGWTRVLRSYGFEVHAVDPGELDPRLRRDGQVHHVRATADVFLRQTAQTFDLAVNDMRMAPLESCRIMVGLANRLRPGAAVVVTLKLGSGDPLPVIHRCVATLREAYEVTFARQLHHNRLEITVLGRLPG